MSWEVSLTCPCCNNVYYATDTPTYPKTEMNVTWNFNLDIKSLFPDGFAQTFDGLTGMESSSLLEKAFIFFGSEEIPEKPEDPWTVGTMFAVMLAWAYLYPEGRWEIM